MKKLLAGLVLSTAALFSQGVMASGDVVPLEKADIDVHNQASLARGAKYFVNYCMGCHSLAFSRYNRLALDAGLTDQQVQENLIFTSGKDGEMSKIGDNMVNAMRPADVEEGFGAAPPDLSLTGRLRGGDWIYSYLKAFYVDPTRPMGVNNTVFPNVGMPHVLWELQGWQKLEKNCTPAAEGHGEHGAQHCTEHLVSLNPGKISGPEYNQVVRDITNFLVYVGEPAQLHRKTIGVFVLLFMVLFGIVAYFLKKEYWKDVH
ncbi:MAG: cytochrome c1 [Thiofilum sp.]|uniref:cytochrome c1 n=1 Tax=Thiofilum sp. TaxID=2212733 RepID=UPI0025FC6F7E|nr:cytochrome c1 [Thiofilum sp.]MBK8453286.1 cytochrome c1 [Thiofilum sp.]